MKRRARSGLSFALLLGFLHGHVASAQEEEEEKELGWADVAELALVTTAGNSEVSTFGFRNLLSRVWEEAELSFEVAGQRTETTTITQVPVGDSLDDFVIQEERESALTAENYLARAKYDQNVNARTFLFGSGGWDRNEFAGIRNRFYGAGGLGTIWYGAQRRRWRTDYGVSVTRQEPTAGERETFAGLRLSSDFLQRLTGAVTVTNLTILDENLDDTDDLRLDSLSALAVNMNDRLAIKVSLHFLFDNVPSFVESPLQLPNGTGTDIIVPVQAKKLDTRVNVALVINF